MNNEVRVKNTKSEAILRLENASVQYGGVKALDGASVSIGAGEVVALMGPNGAGKSTVLKAMFGLAPLSHGHALWHGERFVPVPHGCVRRGIAFVPQGRRVFRYLTVEENLELGGFSVSDKAEVKRRIHEAFELFPALKAKRSAQSGTLSGGQQQMLAIARGLMIDPKVLLLDEPSLGLAPKIVTEVFEKIREISERHAMAVAVVEHNIKSLLHIVHRAYVLDKGKVSAEGEPNGIVSSGILEKVFLGGTV